MNLFKIPVQALTLVALAALVGCGGSDDGDQSGGGISSSTGGDAGGGGSEGGGQHIGGVKGSGGGVVKGMVVMKGEAPAAATKKIDLSGNPDCGMLHTDGLHYDSLITGEGGRLANVYVYVDGGWEMDPPEQASVIDQVECQYVPKVQGIMVDQTLKIVSSDELNHNVHIFPRANEEDNLGYPKPDSRDYDFPEAETVPILFKCDLHPWMKGYVGVLSHPFFAVTGTEGSFEIHGVPAGDWKLVIWHELKGKQVMDITVTEGGTVEMNDLVFEF